MGQALRLQGRVLSSVAVSLLALGCSDALDEAASTNARIGDEQVKQPLAASKPLLEAISERIDAGSYRFVASEKGFRAYSAEEHLDAHFDARGAHLSARSASTSGDAEVTLRFAAWGRAGAERTVADVAAKLGACSSDSRVDEHGECLKRLELEREGLLEWWDNRSRGIEQGWTISEKPAGAGPIRLLVDVEGATASSADDNAVTLRQPDGAQLAYDELSIVDATGKTLAGGLRADGGRIVISFDDNEATYPITVDPLVSVGWFPNIPQQQQSWLGLHMTALGDVNGDGYEDFAIAAHSYPTTQASAGKVFVYYGLPGDPGSPASGPSNTPSWEKAGTHAAGAFGYGLAGGDFNGDGYGDLLVGEPGYGAAYVYFGSSTGLGSSPGWSVSGSVPSDGFGWSVASAGDVNGDGCSDVLIGVPFASSPETEEGKAALYLGATNIASMSTSPVWTRYSNYAGARFGFSLAGVGDVNGDGRSDVVIGAPGYNNATGRVWGYLGTSAGLGNAVWTPTGTQVGEGFGNTIAPAGDENGDGYADVLVSAPGFDDGAKVDAGRLFIFSSSAAGFGASVVTEVGTTANEQMGLHLAGAGDINGDGKADAIRNGAGGDGIVRFGRGAYPTEADDVSNYAYTSAGIGDIMDDGFADIAFGDPWVNNGTGYAQIRAGRPAGPPVNAIDPTLTDGVATSQFGNAVADAGDVNGDGYSDLLVGANQTNNGGGKAFLYFGNNALPTWSQSSVQANGHLGTAFAGCDFNNDGFSDIAISAPDYDDTHLDQGIVLVYNGSANGVLGNPKMLEVPQSRAQFGAALSAGDVNGDGYCDLAVGAPLYDNGEMDEGRVYIYPGSGNGLAAPQTLENNSAGSFFGSALSFGDANGDDRKDLAVGAKNYSNGQAGEGRVSVFLANVAGILNSVPDWSVESDVAGANFGAALSMASDIDNNSLSDLIVGAPNYTRNAAQQGSVYYYENHVDGFAYDSSYEGGTSGEKLGSVIATGDVNGDGYGDLAYTGTSRVTVRLGTLNGFYSNDTFTRVAGAGESALGRGLSLSGDLNGDGSSDLSAGLLLASGGGVRTWRLEKGGAKLQALRPATSTVIAPGGKSSSNSLVIRMFARSPYGRTRMRLQVIYWRGAVGQEVFSPGWVDSGVAGTTLSVQISGLLANTAYHYQARVLYPPTLGFGATHSRWYYGGDKGYARGTHFRTP